MSSLNFLKRVTDLLDARLLRWIGSILTLWAVVSLGVGLVGKIVGSGYKTGANILIAIGAIGLFVGVVVLVLGLFTAGLPMRTTDEDPPHDDSEIEVDAENRELKAATESELVALIDEWKALRASEFTETANAPYSFLLRRSSEFIETILGRAEAQRFEDNGAEKPGTFNQLVDLRVRALSLLRDNCDSWHFQVDLAGLAAAAATRKEIDYGSTILIAGSPLESHYEIPSDPDSLTPSGPVEAPDGEVEPEWAPVAVLAPDDDLEAALRAERNEGRKLLKALRGGIFESWQYDRVATTDDIHGWQANVEHLLHGETELLQLLRWQPLTRNMGISWTSVADVLMGGPEVRRLEGLLAQLDKVIERLSR